MPASKKNKTTPPATLQNFPVVGIGASAGGLDAFKQLLKAIPEDSGMAYVLVQHLAPTHESMLPEILARVTKLPVNEITDDIHLAPNHIYVIPSAKILTATDGVLKLSERTEKYRNFCIDIFFRSLGEVHKELAAGVVLSGTGTDGALGLKAIKDYGGITIAQDKSAAYSDMPQHAVDTGVVDFVLPPHQIPKQLLQISSHYFSAVAQDKKKPVVKKDDASIFKQILLLLHQRSGVDFTYYKQNTIHRRLARRMALHKRLKIADYLKFLRSDKAEQDALFQDMLIPVTSFFRDPKTFDALCNDIFPLLFKKASPSKEVAEPIRIWVAGCSTGEETYSIAICLHEFFGEKLSGMKVQVFASDISEIAIKKARAGVYSKIDLQAVSDARLKKYFKQTNGHFEVNKVIRNICVFAPHNFLKDPPFAKIDLISCRNVLIYMDNYLQKRALTTFHYSLNKNGFLLLGKSETPSAASELFTVHNKHNKFYAPKPVPSRYMHVATERKEETLALQNLPARQAGKMVTKPEPLQTDFRKSAEAILLLKYTPAAVIVNEQMDIVHIHGSITPFLEPSPGKPTFNLLKMAREGLGFELRNGIHKAKTSNAPVIREGIPSKPNGKQHLVTLEIVPLTNTVEPHYLILFTKTAVSSAVSLEKAGVRSKPNEEAKLHIQQLEKDLAQAREDMRSISEEQEVANEELQSANEELQSSNEEMQSLNEELETSKEELQSSNEELTVVNQELSDKQMLLNDAKLYSEAIITTIREPLIILDKVLRIKTANESFYQKFNLTERETEGKLFYDIANNQWDDGLLTSVLLKILPQKTRVKDFEIELKFPGMGLRHMLLNARQIINEATEQQLILLAIEDVTEQVLAHKKIEDNKKELQLLFRQAPTAIQVLRGTDFIFEICNTRALEILNKPESEVLGKRYVDVFPEAEDLGLMELLKNVYRTGEAYTNEEMPVFSIHEKKKIEWYAKFTFAPIKDIHQKVAAIMITGEDITPQVTARKRIEESEKRFSKMVYESPFAFAILKGKDMVITLANDAVKEIWGKGKNIEGKPLLEVLPEIKDQVFPKLLDEVYTTGIPHLENESLVTLQNDGILKDIYFNLFTNPTVKRMILFWE